MLLSDWILNNKHAESEVWRAQSVQAGFLPKLSAFGAATKAASLNPRCWLWTYSSFLFMEILLQARNVSVVPKGKGKEKKKKKHTWIVLCLGGWRCTFYIKATCSPWIKLNIWKHWWKGEQRQIYRIVEEGTEDGSAVVVLIWMSVNLSWKKVNWTSDREKKECKAEAS